MLRLLHTSDWQIGKLFGQFDADDAAILADARFHAVERIAAMATEHRADLVLVAGDIFDAQTVSDRTIRRLFKAMVAYQGPWILIPGNHDAALGESVWTRARRIEAVLPHVRLCTESHPLILADLGLALLPAPLTQRNTYADLTRWFDSADTPAGLLRVGMAHGSVQGILAEDVDSPNPIAADRAQTAGLDYLALGDWHGMRRIDARAWYSGTPETDRFRANASGQTLLVDIDGPGATPAVTPLQVGAYRWRAETISVQVPSDVDAALLRLAALESRDVVQLACQGHADLDGYDRLRRGIEQARGTVRAMVAELAGLALQPTADDLEALQADGYVGEVVAALRQAQEGADGELARDALALLAAVLRDRAGLPAHAPEAQ